MSLTVEIIELWDSIFCRGGMRKAFNSHKHKPMSTSGVERGRGGEEAGLAAELSLPLICLFQFYYHRYRVSLRFMHSQIIMSSYPVA